MRGWGTRQKRKKFAIGVSLVVFLFLFGFSFLVISRSVTIPLALSLIEIVVIIVIYKLADSHEKDWEHFKDGEGAERAVKEVLETIPFIKAYHDIVIGDNTWNIDHVVITQNKVYAIETKFRKKSLDLENTAKQVKGSALDLKNYLVDKLKQKLPGDFRVEPVIVYLPTFKRHYSAGFVKVFDIANLRKFFDTAGKYTAAPYIQSIRDALDELDSKD